MYKRQPDDTVGNDDGGELNGDTDNTTGNEQGDEDDSDPAAICTFVIECPEDIVATDGCTVEPFDNLADAGFLLGESCDNLMVGLSVEDELIPFECIGGDFIPTRTVIRTYTFLSENGGFEESCPQEITYQFTECNQVVDAGAIAIDGSSLLLVPSGCDVPPITESVEATASGCNDLVEHMWLRTTVERSNGLPFIPNPLNTCLLYTSPSPRD